MIAPKHRLALKVTGGVVSVLYVAVMVVAVACAFGHAAPAHAHHHQSQDQPGHSALCLWACQANIGVSLFSAPHDGQPQAVSHAPVVLSVVAVHRVPLSLLHLRGPPLG